MIAAEAEDTVSLRQMLSSVGLTGQEFGSLLKKHQISLDKARLRSTPPSQNVCLDVTAAVAERKEPLAEADLSSSSSCLCTRILDRTDGDVGSCCLPSLLAPQVWTKFDEMDARLKEHDKMLELVWKSIMERDKARARGGRSRTPEQQTGRQAPSPLLRSLREPTELMAWQVAVRGRLSCVCKAHGAAQLNIAAPLAGCRRG